MTPWPQIWTRRALASSKAIARRNAREAAIECRARRLAKDEADRELNASWTAS